MRFLLLANSIRHFVLRVNEASDLVHFLYSFDLNNGLASFSMSFSRRKRSDLLTNVRDRVQGIRQVHARVNGLSIFVRALYRRRNLHCYGSRLANDFLLRHEDDGQYHQQFLRETNYCVFGERLHVLADFGRDLYFFLNFRAIKRFHFRFGFVSVSVECFGRYYGTVEQLASGDVRLAFAFRGRAGNGELRASNEGDELCLLPRCQ